MSATLALHPSSGSLSATATADAKGNVAFSFGGPYMGMVRTGSIVVPGAQPTSVLPIVWTSTIGGTPWGQWYNAQASATLQVLSGGQIVVTGTGLGAGQSVQATFTYYDSPGGQSLWPGSTPAPPPSGPVVLVDTGVTPVTVPAFPSTQIYGPFPVIIGTGLEIAQLVPVTNNVRVDVQWQHTVGNTVIFTAQQTFDVDGSSSIQGWTMPNYDSQVVIQLTANASTPAAFSAITGMPAVNLPPVVPDKVLGNQFGVSVPATTNQSFLLAPYSGDADVWFSPASPSSPTVAMEIQCFDILDNLVHKLSITETWPSTSGPNRAAQGLYLPPLRNFVVLQNGSAAPVTFSFGVTAQCP